MVIGAGFDDEKSLLMSQMSLEKRFGQSAVFVASTLMENGGVPQSAMPETLLKEAIHVISCGYEDKTEWGSEVCWNLLINVINFMNCFYENVTSNVPTNISRIVSLDWNRPFCLLSSINMDYWFQPI